MNPTWFTAIFAGLAIAGQIANYMLNLRLRAAVSEIRQQILDEVEARYVTEKVCLARCMVAELADKMRRAEGHA